MAEPNAASAVGAEDVTDEDLLERFTLQQEEAAFAVLVRRYGRLVLGVCRRVLHHEQDAEDAVQAVFCVLARRAGSIRKPGAVGAWLHAVAYHIACKAQARRGRRPVPTTNLADIPAKEDSPEWTWREVRPILDEEVNRLPEKYRQAFVLCYLEGRTNKQAADQLGCPLGTVLSRLARAREQLRKRLTRRGLVLSVGALTIAVTREANAVEMPPSLTNAAFGAALASTGGTSSSAALSSSVSALTTEYLQSRSQASRPHTRPIQVAIVLLAVILLCTVIALLRKAAPDPTAQIDQQLLQGTWREGRVEMGGIEFQRANIRLTFVGDQFTLTSDLGFRIAGRFRLDATRTPREITLMPEQGGESPGIYRIDGNSLKICVNQNGAQRPKTFTSAGREAFFLYVLERQSATQ